MLPLASSVWKTFALSAGARRADWKNPRRPMPDSRPTVTIIDVEQSRPVPLALVRRLGLYYLLHAELSRPPVAERLGAADHGGVAFPANRLRIYHFRIFNCICSQLAGHRMVSRPRGNYSRYYGRRDMVVGCRSQHGADWWTRRTRDLSRRARNRRIGGRAGRRQTEWHLSQTGRARARRGREPDRAQHRHGHRSALYRIGARTLLARAVCDR